MAKELHTIDIISEIARRNKDVKEFNIAVYRYVPQALTNNGRLKTRIVKSTPINRLVKSIRSIKISKVWSIGLMSRVKMKNGQYYHIPQIDFEIPVSKDNLNLVKKCLSGTVKVFPGYILQTGNSYHYLGLKLLKQKGWQEFIGRCVLCNKPRAKTIVDSRWCGHSLITDCTNLRIFANHSKTEPRVIEFIAG